MLPAARAARGSAPSGHIRRTFFSLARSRKGKFWAAPGRPKGLAAGIVIQYGDLEAVASS